MDNFSQINDIINSIFDMSRIERGKFIASGTFGDVWRCRDKQTHKGYALKILKKEKMCSNSVLFFCREVFSQIYGAHPAIVPIIGWNVIDDMNQPNMVIVTKYMHQGTLSGYIQKLNNKNELINPTTATIIIYGIARAMKHLHALNILHRDLKPANIFVDNNLYPYIADLGLAKLLSENNVNQSQQCGTLLYLAPEIFCGTNYSYPVDVYSYACIVYEIIEMHIPAYSRNSIKPVDLYQKLRNGIRPTLKIATQAQSDFLNMMWCLNPEERLTFSQIVAELEKDSTYWFDGTDKVKFEEYKDHLDRHEKQLNKSSDIEDDSQTENGKMWVQLIASNDIDASFVREIIQLAQNNDQKAQELAAILYHTGQIVLKSPFIGSHYAHKSGSKYLQMLARNTCLPSTTNECEIGEIYESCGSLKEALVHYQKSAEVDRNPRAMWRWADILLNYDIDCKIEEGVKLLQIAADFGDPCACYDMAKLLITAQYVERDIKKAIEYLKVSVEKDHPDAPAMTGYAFAKINDIESAKHYYKLALTKFADTESQKVLDLFV